MNLFLAIVLDGFTQNLVQQKKEEIIDEEHLETEEQNFFKNGLAIGQELLKLLPKDSLEYFVQELTDHYLKKIMLNEERKGLISNNCFIYLNILR